LPFSFAKQKNASIADVWDGGVLKISFRRRVSPRLKDMWIDLVNIVENMCSQMTYCDAIIWSFDSGGKFSVNSMYKTISFRGIQPEHTPAVWNITVPPRIHIFLWLLANNKTLTRSNLAKRREVEDVSCLFCLEQESVNHLFFSCCVAATRSYIAEIFNKDIGCDFESVG